MNSFFDLTRCNRYFCRCDLIRSVVICSCLGMCSMIVEGEECFNPTSKIAETKSRCKSSGHVNRFDHRPSSFLDFLPLPLPLLPLFFPPPPPTPLLLLLTEAPRFLLERPPPPPPPPELTSDSEEASAGGCCCDETCDILDAMLEVLTIPRDSSPDLCACVVLLCVCVCVLL